MKKKEKITNESKIIITRMIYDNGNVNWNIISDPPLNPDEILGVLERAKYIMTKQPFKRPIEKSNGEASYIG